MLMLKGHCTPRRAPAVDSSAQEAPMGGGGGGSATSTTNEVATDTLEIVVCCSGTTLTALEPSIEMLRSLGVRVALVELGAEPLDELEQALDEIDEGAIWALCDPRLLDHVELARARTRLIAGGVGRRRIIEFRPDWRDPLELFQRIEAAGWLADATDATDASDAPAEPESPPVGAPELLDDPDSQPVLHGHADDDGPSPRWRRRVFVGTSLSVGAVLVALLFVIASGSTQDTREGEASVMVAGLSGLFDVDLPEPSSPTLSEAQAASEAPRPEQVEARELRIDAAIGRGQLDRHEGLLFVPPAAKANYEAARARCETLEIAGEDDWRLASIGELHGLVRARELRRRASYWSSTDTDEFGDRALVWHGRKMRATPIGKRWKGARGVCVLDDDDQGPASAG